MELNGKQRAYLRSLCNTLQPVLYIGQELIKCSLNDTAPLDAREACGILCDRLGAVPVQCIGRKFSIFRRNEKEPKIEL